MLRTDEKLESLFAKVRTLTTMRQELAVEALLEIADPSLYILSNDERAVLEPALERAQRNEFASEKDVSEVLDKSWS